MPTRLPVPLAYYPRTEQDLATISERLGGRVSLCIGEKIEKTVIEDGKPTKKLVPAFVEWWVEYPAEFIPPATPPAKAPADEKTRAFLSHAARIAARAWVKELKGAKAWDAPPSAVPDHGDAGGAE